MTATLYGEVDGKPVPLADCDWALWKPCGCVQAVAAAACLKLGHIVPTEDAAWKEFYDRAAKRAAAVKRGMRVELITHERWCAELMDAFGKPCPHRAGEPA